MTAYIHTRHFFKIVKAFSANFRLVLFLPTFLISFISFSQQGIKPVNEKIEGHIFKPAGLKPTSQNIASLNLPKGFKISVFAELKEPRIIKISNNGTVYVTHRNKKEGEEDELLMLKDSNGDGKADKQQSIWKKDQLHGITIDGEEMYLITVNTVYYADILDDGTISEAKVIINGLPDGGQHANRTLKVGPDDKLYISIGSTCNACTETSDKSATLIKADKDGSNLEIFSRGLRNTIGFDWHPETKELWGMDHGIDWLGDEQQKEELNKLEAGNDYGWPYIFGNSQYNPADEPATMSYEEYAKKSTEPVLLLPAHSAPMELVFYRGEMFPEQYQNDAFLALHGSWNRKTPVGYKVVRIKFQNGEAVGYENFLTGFLAENNQSHFGRPVGIAQHPDGSLFITDDSGGMIYRVIYEE